MATIDPVPAQHENRQTMLNKRLQGIAWALFLIMTGALWLFSHAILADGLWFLGIGSILLGLNVLRIVNDIETSGFSQVLGLLALSIGVGRLMEVTIPILPVLFIGLGAAMILHPLYAKYAGQQKTGPHGTANREA